MIHWTLIELLRESFIKCAYLSLTRKLEYCVRVDVLPCQQCVRFWWSPSDPIKFLKRLKKCYAVLRARRTVAVTRPLELWLLLRDHAQAAGVWKTDAVN